ncbi:MAG: HAD family hydrolase [Planctomycetes bacterium]|nr:HAD family hydrolase [Planctomycetota bacterium]
MHQTAGQVLLVDADDTLWENEAYFRQVFEQFLDIMEARGHLRSDALDALQSVERERCVKHGYGSRNFARSMDETVRQMEGETPSKLMQEIDALVQWILDHPVEPFPGVAETLEDLASRHRMLLVTKGAHQEQNDKVERSGFARWFIGVEILFEKNAEHYREIVARNSLDSSITWMIGNSPKSDINMAMAAGLRTVFIPHRTIWGLERQPFTREPDLVLTQFSDLRLHF